MTLVTKNFVPPFPAEALEAIAKVLADTSEGLTGAEIGNLLNQLHSADPTPEQTKWKRLFNAFVAFHNTHQSGNLVIAFITRALSPARYTDEPEAFARRREKLNAVLALSGYEIREDGKARRVDQAHTLDDALQRSNRLKAKLRQREVHEDVLRFCTEEIIAKNYFHAVFEATKSVTHKVRQLSGFDDDGVALVDAAFAGKPPVLVINSWLSRTEQGEQRGFVSLLKGVYGVVRNPLAHEAKIEWEMTEQDALDTLTMLSLIHRKLDKARHFPTANEP